MRNPGLLAAVVLMATLGVAAPASAKKTTLNAHVIGQPQAAKKATAVRVLLTPKSAKRAKLDSQVGVLTVRAKTVKAPRRTRLATHLLRVNDYIRARVRVGKRARRASQWQIRTRTLKVQKRSKTLSAAELQQLLAEMRGDLTQLDETVSGLAHYTVAAFELLSSDLAALRADMDAIRADLTALEAAPNGAVTELAAEFAALEGQVAALTEGLRDLGELLAGIAPGDLAGALSEIDALQTDLAGLETTVAGLTTTLGALCGEPLITLC